MLKGCPNKYSEDHLNTKLLPFMTHKPLMTCQILFKIHF